MPNVTVASAGTSGPRGFSWLSGAGAPTANMVGSLDGDFYLDTTNVGFYYGPRTAGLWGTPHAFGNSLNGVPLTNVTATVAPTISNDQTQGYSRGSTWINTTNGLYYICTSAATGAAVWQQLLPSGGTNSVTVTGTPAFGRVIAATGATTAAWQLPPTAVPSTGIISGGLMTAIPSTNQFTVTQGQGYIVDYVTTPSTPTITPVTIPAQTVTISGAAAGRVVNWWVSDASGNITAQAARPTDVQRRTLIQLGITGSTPPGGVIFSLQSLPVVLNQPHNQMYDLMYNLGPFNPGGNLITGNANLTFNKAVGTFFSPSFGWGLAASQPNDPHVVAAPAETPAQFLYALQTSGSETTTPTSAFDPVNYDVNGVKTAIPGGVGTTVIHRVWLFGSGIATDQLIVQYGQTTYGSLSAAQAAIGTSDPFVPNPDFVGIGTVCAWIATTKACTALNNTSTAIIATASKFPAF